MGLRPNWRIVVALILAGFGTAAAQVKDYPIRPVTTVHLNDPFWAPRIETLRTVTLPAALQRCQDTGRIANFEHAAAVLRGDTTVDRKPPANPFDDADVYKLIEAASYCLAAHPDAKLEAKLDDLIAKIAAAQEKDGYLYTARTIDPEHPPALAGADRWANEKADSFELSNLGYLYDAAVAHFQATGKRSLLDVAIKSADLLDRTFGPGKKSIYPGHEIVEMALVRLSRATGESRYLTLSKFFLDQRGPSATASAPTGRGRGAAPANQTAARVVDQVAATGNAVNAAYLYSGMADIAALLDDAAYSTALDKIWANAIGQKMYVTGGIGSTPADGSFGLNYRLPNLTAGSSTTASAANVMWNQRMFLRTGDSKYVDVLERTLYNALAAGFSLDGKTYFDANILEATGRQQRRPWPLTAPAGRGPAGNALMEAFPALSATPLLASVPAYQYARTADALYVNLYAAGTADIKLDNGRTIKFAQETKYPWDGAVKLTISPDQPTKFTLKLRVPAWDQAAATPDDLYTLVPQFVDGISRIHTLKVAGQSMPIQPKNGYVSIDRQWSAGDIVELNLPMEVRQIKANDQVADDRARLALQRGPIVYCVEGPDQPKAKVRNLLFPEGSPITAEFKPDLLGGVEVLHGIAQALTIDDTDKLVRTDQDFTAIPYACWANRGAGGTGGAGEMLVWLPSNPAVVVPTSNPTLAMSARITASNRQNGTTVDGRAAQDGLEPRASNDNSPLSHFDWWPDTSTADKPTTEWCAYTWDHPVTISQTSVYWWDDTGTGECRVPTSWKAFYKDGDKWVPVETNDAYGTARDQYNKVTFKPVTTTALRLEIVIVPSQGSQRLSVGIQEWKVR